MLNFNTKKLKKNIEKKSVEASPGAHNQRFCEKSYLVMLVIFQVCYSIS